jgi:hypothetical protein
MGTFHYKKFDIGLRFIYYYLIFLIPRETFQPYLKSASHINIEHYLYTLLFSFFYSVSFFYWAGLRNIKKIILIEIPIILFLTFFEISFIGLDTFRVSILSVFINVLFTLFIVYLINKTLNSSHGLNEKRVKLLILIPNLIYYVYFNALDIMMIFLYSSKTKELFIKLYNVNLLLLIGLYTCFSLAFYLKPKKEVYLQ